jgi:hypothetical protein
MTQLLIRALEAAASGPAEKKQLQEQIVKRFLPVVERELGMTYMIQGEDGKPGKARELLLSTAIESGTLIQTEIHRTIIEGAEPARCFRGDANGQGGAMAGIPMKAKSIQVNIGETGSYAPIVPEGAEIPVKTQDYTPRTWTAVKFGERPIITQEMIDDSLFAAAELEVRKAGKRIENTLNQWCVQVLMDNAGNEYDINAAAGTVAGVQAIIGARTLLIADGYIPNTYVAHPNASQYLLKDFIPGYTPEALAIVKEATLPRVVGCNGFECGVECTTTTSPYPSASYVWGAPTDSYIGYLVYDRDNAGYIGTRQDIVIKNFNDVIRDLVNFTVTGRYAVQYGVANAISRVEFGGA